MESVLKQRLIGAAVLVALAMIFLPMLLKGPDPADQDAAQVPLAAPAAPEAGFETREVPLALPVPAAPDGEAVLDPVAPSATVTVDPEAAAPRVDFDPAAAPEDDGAPLPALDAATGEALAPEPAPEPDEVVDVEPATPAPRPAPLPVTTAAGKYAVNVGSFSNLDNARALADRLRAARLPVTTENVQVNGKAALRVRVGPYAERTLAEAARLRVEGLSGGSAVVIALDGATPAAGTAAPRPTTAPPAAADVGFAVQLGALSSEADANVLVGRARSAGFVAFHQRVDTAGGAVWRVRVGPEADRAAAERLRDDVAGKLGIADAIVVSHP